MQRTGIQCVTKVELRECGGRMFAICERAKAKTPAICERIQRLLCVEIRPLNAGRSRALSLRRFAYVACRATWEAFRHTSRLPGVTAWTVSIFRACSPLTLYPVAELGTPLPLALRGWSSSTGEEVFVCNPPFPARALLGADCVRTICLVGWSPLAASIRMPFLLHSDAHGP